MKFQFMPVDHLIKFLHKLRLDKIVGVTGEYLNKLCNGFPAISKLSKVLIDKEGQENDFFS